MNKKKASTLDGIGIEAKYQNDVCVCVRADVLVKSNDSGKIY